MKQQADWLPNSSLTASGRFLLRMFGAYIGALLAGSIFIVVNNLIVFDKTAAELLSFNIPFIAACDLVLALILLVITYFRLRSALHYLAGRSARASREEIFEKLLRFPTELFGGIVLLSMLFTTLYHTIEIILGHRRIASWAEIVQLANNVLAEMSLALLLALLLFTVTRRLLRTYVIKLRISTLPDTSKHSAVWLVVIATVISFVMTFVAAYRLIMKSAVRFDGAGFWLLSGLYAIFAATIVCLFMYELRKELKMLAAGLLRIAQGSKNDIHQAFPVLTSNETGRMAGALNLLQQRISHAYEEVERQLELAAAVQQQLLPKTLPDISGLQIAVTCRQCSEVGGDFYDVIPLGGHRYCVAIGDVTGKGLPASLLMSAVMTGLRAEAASCHTSAELLNRLNRHVYQMTQGRIYTTMGLAMIELRADQIGMDYASAGHLDPYCIRDGQVLDWQYSSLPLGMSPDAEYTGAKHTIEDMDTVVLYTDGIIEARGSSGVMAGFEKWEQALRKVSPNGSLQEQLENLLLRMELTEGAGLHDDYTLVMISRRQDPSPSAS